MFVLTLIAAMLFPLRSYWLEQSLPLLTVTVPVILAVATGIWLAFTKSEMRFVVLGTAVAGFIGGMILTTEVLIGSDATAGIRRAQSYSNYSIQEFAMLSLVVTTFVSTILGGAIGRSARWIRIRTVRVAQ